MKMLYPLINYSSKLQIKCSLLSYWYFIYNTIVNIRLTSVGRRISHKNEKTTNNTKQISQEYHISTYGSKKNVRYIPLKTQFN